MPTQGPALDWQPIQEPTTGHLGQGDPCSVGLPQRQDTAVMYMHTRLVHTSIIHSINIFLHHYVRSSPDVPRTQYTLHIGLLTCSFLISDEISIHYEYLEYVCV